MHTIVETSGASEKEVWASWAVSSRQLVRLLCPVKAV